MKLRIFVILILIITQGSCNKDADNSLKNNDLDLETALFTKVLSSDSGINFINEVVQTEDFNFMAYEYIYNGAGLAVLDYDNDGLLDLYFVSNFRSNKLYRNLGNFNFEDVTESSGTSDIDGFSTGVSVLDVNNDGYPDLHISKAGSLDNEDLRRNIMFVNQKDGTFKNEAKERGLDHPGYSAQIYPFDYDNDGDKDLYLINYREDFINVAIVSDKILKDVKNHSSDQLFRNDGGIFTNVSASLGMMNKTWGMSAVISDFNEDGLEDLFVCNDFSDPDFLYTNLGNGAFVNQTKDRFQHISHNSMGSDFADINNDLRPDLITLDMLSDNYARSKENMSSMDTEFFREMVRIGFHHSYMANTLHLNKGYGIFEEIGQLSGVTKTDWSWSALMADFDNDGWKDLFVTNGVEREYNNQDVQRKVRAMRASGEPLNLQEILAMYPSEPIMNHIYQNMGNLSFEKRMKEWGVDDKNFSYGAAYADLDNDGDLDLVTNNLYSEAGIYRNNSTNNFLDIVLKGPELNPMGIGSKVYVITDTNKQMGEQFLARGYYSSVTDILHFGLSDESEVKELYVKWPDGKSTRLENVKANQKIVIDYSSASNDVINLNQANWAKQLLNPADLGITYQQKENDFDDFTVQLLLPQKQSTKGSPVIVGDVNNDGLEDFFVGNAANASAALYIQQPNGTFNNSNQALWNQEAGYEDSNALFIDVDGDADLDLYVVSTGYELTANNKFLQDRLYLNDGSGSYSKSPDALPEMLTAGKAIASNDFDNDGDQDIFVGGNLVPGHYPQTPRSYLLRNDNGTFTDVLNGEDALANAGMVSDAIFTDYDNDNDKDLLLVGEWMQPLVFTNFDGKFEPAQNLAGLDQSEGWWFNINAADFDKDGDQDYIVGNLGMNNKFQPKPEKPLFIYAKDFDNNGSFDVALSKLNKGKLVPVRGKECSSEQNPFLLDKIKTYKEFASLDMEDIYGKENLDDALKFKASMFESAYIENLGNGEFKIHKLPVAAQKGPTLSTYIDDFNNDGNPDIMGIGAIYDAEVETIRYDSNFGYVLLGDGNNGFKASERFEPLVRSDAKDLTAININGRKYFIVVSNNAPVEIFTYNP